MKKELFFLILPTFFIIVASENDQTDDQPSEFIKSLKKDKYINRLLSIPENGTITDKQVKKFEMKIKEEEEQNRKMKEEENKNENADHLKLLGLLDDEEESEKGETGVIKFGVNSQNKKPFKKLQRSKSFELAKNLPRNVVRFVTTVINPLVHSKQSDKKFDRTVSLGDLSKDEKSKKQIGHKSNIKSLFYKKSDKERTTNNQIAPLRGWPLKLPVQGNLLNMHDKPEKQTPLISLGDLIKTPETTLSDLFKSES